uniref:Uncharacterized protein n=1 Tax=Tetranychus urticae TaxID=32264 RepID=T1KUN2_TETUR
MELGGLLQYESEYVAGLEHTLTWRPEGNLITSSRYYQNKHEIVFFEKNGLRHGEFNLPIEPGSFIIRQLTWSTDSKVFLVHGYDCNRNLEIVFLYTMRNYHWYLKQCFKFNERLDLIAWDPSSQLIFYIVTSRGIIKQYSFSWVTDRFDDLVAVIDGCKVQFTPFKFVSIPPPMSAYSIIFDNPINEVIFYRSQIFGIYNCEGKLFIYQTSEGESDSDAKIEINVRNTSCSCCLLCFRSQPWVAKQSVSPDKSKNDADESESEKSSNTTVEKYETGKIERLLAEIQELLANAEEGNESEPSKDKPKPQMNKPKPSMNKPKPPCYKPHPRFDFPSHPSASHGVLLCVLFIENDVLNIYFDNGIILTYSCDSKEVNCIGAVENGIAAVVSSPDQERISLISKKDKLSLFTRFFDILVEKDLHADHSECIQKKLSLVFNKRLDLIAWHPSSQLIFYIVTSRGIIKQYSFSWVTDQFDDLVSDILYGKIR